LISIITPLDLLCCAKTAVLAHLATLCGNRVFPDTSGRKNSPSRSVTRCNETHRDALLPRQLSPTLSPRPGAEIPYGRIQPFGPHHPSATEQGDPPMCHRRKPQD